MKQQLGEYTADVKSQVIGTGDKAIYTTIANMRRLAKQDSNSKEIQEIANKVLSNTSKKNKNGLAIEAFNEVKKIISYRYDHENVTKYFKVDDPQNIEFLIRPKYFAAGAAGHGDCDDMSTLLASVYLCLGLRVNLVIIAHKGGSREFSHVYNEVIMTNKSGKQFWVPADLVKGEFGWAKTPTNRVEYFEVI